MTEKLSTQSTVIRNLFLLLFLSFISFSLQAQKYSFSETGNLTILDKDGNELDLALVGGFNQSQFISIDVNNDGKKDVVVYDRTGRKILPLIFEQGKLRYHPEYEECFPVFEAWVVGTDFNNDQKTDIWFSKNDYIALYKNVTGPGDKKVRFEKVSDELRGYNFNTEGLDTTSLYSMKFNQPAMQDVDLDGDIDVLTLQPFGYGITLFLNNTVENNKPLDPPDFEEVDFCWADFEEGINNDTILLKRNKFCFSANYRYKKKHSGGSSLLLIDMDDDQDMDLILGNAGFNNLIYLKNGKTEHNKDCDTMISYDLQFPASKPARVDLFPASFYLDVDNDGLKDLIVAASLADYSSGYTRETNQIWYYKNEGSQRLPDFQHKQDDFLVGRTVDYGGYTAPYLFDIDKDGDLDLFLASNGDYFETRDSSDRIIFLENTGSKTNPVFQEKDTDFLGLSQKKYRNLTLSFGEVNDDGVIDLLVGKANGKLDWYSIEKVGANFQLKDNAVDAFNIDVFETASPNLVDVNQDKLVDLLVGCYGGNTYYYKNTGTASAPQFQLETDTFGKVLPNELIPTVSQYTNNDTFVHDYTGYSHPSLIDINGDGYREFISGGNDGRIKIFDRVDNNLDGTFTPVKNIYYEPVFKQCMDKDFGSRSTPVFADLNDDGLMDVIVGNRRGGIHFLQGVDSNCLVNIHDVRTADRHVEVFPNPTHDEMNIRTTSEVSIKYIELYDLKGNLLMRQDENISTISLKDYPGGVYSLGVMTSAGISYKKIVKYH